MTDSAAACAERFEEAGAVLTNLEVVSYTMFLSLGFNNLLL